MLLRQFIFIYSLLYGFSLFGQKMPEYNTVLRKLYSEYKVHESSVFVELAKTREGWKVNTSRYKKPGLELVGSELFYNKKRGSYEKLSFTTLDSAITSDKELSQNGYYWSPRKAYNFERCAYFGYKQWTWDVITDFGNLPNPSNVELEGLSRAYSEYARTYLLPGWLEHEANTHLPGRGNTTANTPIERRFVDSFLFYTEKGLAALKELAKRDPNYRCKVGHVRNKLANEHMDIFLILYTVGHADLAISYLNRAEYDLTTLSIARNYLYCLPENSILFCENDNDTYPLWYLINSSQFRKDVSVVTMSLLQLAQYTALYQWKNSLLGYARAEAFVNNHWTFPEDYLLFQQYKTSDDGIPLDSVLNFYYVTQPAHDQGHTTLSFMTIALKHGNASSVFHPNKHYLTNAEITMLDIINSSERPITFTPYGDYYTTSYDGLIKKGNHYELTTETPCLECTMVDSAAIASYYSDRFLRIAPDVLGSLEKNYVLHENISFYLRDISIAIQWTMNRKPENLDRLVAIGTGIYPDGHFYYNSGWKYLIEALLMADRRSDAEIILEQLISYIREHEPANIQWNKTHYPEDEIFQNHTSLLPDLEYLISVLQASIINKDLLSRLRILEKELKNQY